MEFGRVSPYALDGVDFNLPPDPPLTTHVLSRSAYEGELKVYVGCTTWGHKDWRGVIFPAKTKDADFLPEYAKHFNSVELNATHYAMYGPDRVKLWKDKAALNPGFKFCPKFPKLITHTHLLRNCDDLTTEFLSSMLAFEEKLGAMFMQMSENFGTDNYALLEKYLKTLPHDLLIFTELRHRNWFANLQSGQAVFELMQRLNIGAVITDTAGRRDAVHMHLTVPHAFIRFVGNGLHPTDYLRMDQWVNRIAKWHRQGLQTLYLVMHQSNEQASPQLCDYFIRQINDALGLQVARPQTLPFNGSLF